MNRSKTIIGKDNWVYMKEDTHQYFTLNGDEYASFSSVKKSIQMPFDSHGMSMRMATNELGKGASSEDIALRAKTIQKEWKGLGDSASEHGKTIHKALEDYSNTGTCPDKYKNMCKLIFTLFAGSRYHFNELIVYSEEHRVAGTFDKGTIRNSNQTILDIYDYKTNERNGILYDSIKRTATESKHYNRYYLGPFSHIEQCNYYDYCLQLSSYGYMAETTYKIKIGRLGIIYISPELIPRLIPVPYMREEAKMLLSFYRMQKQLP